MALDSAVVSILIKAKDEATKVLKDVEKSASGLSKTFGSAMKPAAIAGAAAVVGVGYALKGFVEDAMAAQEVMAQTNAVLESTHGAAGMTADSVTDLADSLSRFTPYDDEAIQSAENLLLTFTSIGKDVFPQATETVLNMSTALGQDLKSSAIQLGKAMNDPITGATALRRVGVALTEQQMEQIKAFQESGDIMSAQGIIMKELQTEFGNSARAAGDTFAGKMKILGTQIDNVKERIGMALIPILSRLADAAIKYVVPAIEDGITALSDFASVIHDSLTGDIAGAAEAFNKLPAPLQVLALWLADNKQKIIDIGEVIKNVLLDALQGWVTIFEALAPKMKEFGQFLIDHKPLLIAVAVAAAAVAAILIGWPVLIAAILVGVGLLTTKLEEWRKDNDDLNTALNTLEATLNTLGTVIQTTTQFVQDHKTAQELLKGLIESIMTPLLGFIAAIQVAKQEFDDAKGAVDRLRDGLSAVTGPMYWVRDAAYAMRDAFWGVRDAIGDAINKLNFFNDLPGVGLLKKGWDNLPGRAAGGMTSGWTIVGERGPEIFNAGSGGMVYSNDESRKMLSGGGGTHVTNYIDKVIISGDPAAGMAALGIAV